MKKDKIAILLAILIIFIIAFVPLIVSIIITLLNQPTIYNCALSVYTGELLAITTIMLNQKRENRTTQKISEEATQHTQENKEDSV